MGWLKINKRRLILTITLLLAIFLVISCQNNISGNVIKESQEQNITNDYNVEVKNSEIINAESGNGYRLTGSLTW
jgi:hypothetical protein|tara:strand:- start:2558 stop:2782 length:225 start_codon:yes stop_codon:yes gene_type:complete